MFETALVESEGRLTTRSKYWTVATLGVNGLVLAVLIAYPMLHPEILSQSAIVPQLIAPPFSQPRAVAPITAHASAGSSTPHVMQLVFHVPTIHAGIQNSHDESAPTGTSIGPMTFGGPDGPYAGNEMMRLLTAQPPVVVKPKQERVKVSGGVIAGNLITDTKPLYPAIAKAAGIAGTVVLHAIISKSGTIENLTVISGPPLLRQAALDGVRAWRYRPFLLNGDPTEVDTVITVNFTRDGDS